MRIQLIKNANELWETVRHDVNDGHAVLYSSYDAKRYEDKESVKSLNYPIVLETLWDERSIFSISYRILSTEEINKLYKEVYLDVLKPYLEIRKKIDKK